MSINDFQKAWAQRFPGCELPRQWEDDVRANLTKHRQNVAALYEELEKEEFYVEYLEQLLADVERAKSNSRLNSLDNDSKSSLISDADSRNCNIKPEDGDRNNFNDSLTCVNDDTKNDITNGDFPSNERKNFVTVISVGGPNNLNDPPLSLIDCNDNSNMVIDQTVTPSNNALENSSPVQKKKPPAPPKKPRKTIPVQAVPPVQKEIVSQSESESPREKSSDNCFENHEEEIIPSLVNQSVESGTISNYSTCSSTTTSSSIILEQRDADIELSNENIDKSISYSDENIYDTVAPDEEGNSVNMVNGDSPDTDYAILSESTDSFSESLPSISSRARIAECLLESQKSVDEDNPEYATYMNIDYFVKNQKKNDKTEPVPSVGESDEEPLGTTNSSDHEIEPDQVADYAEKKGSGTTAPSDDVFDMDSGVYSSSVESTSFLCGSSPPSSNKRNDSPSAQNKKKKKNSEAERTAMLKRILDSISDSETVYIECLNTLLQYMKAFKSTIGTSQPLLSLDDYNVIFFRIPELHNIHVVFLKGLGKHSDKYDGTQPIGEVFKELANKLGVYGSFLKNYSKAIETVRKCSLDNVKFSEITKSIKLKALPGQETSLEDLLHKPVARVQKNALVLHDLLQNTPEQHQDYKSLRTALKMTQCFLKDINVSATESMFPVIDRAQRRLVKNTFIVELSEGHRKLRHLFLFNDVIVCARYKPATRQKFTFEVKWFIPLCEIELLDSTMDGDAIKESSPFDVLSLKSRASNIRDQILKEEKGKERRTHLSRNADRFKKKLAEIEAQLVLASPNLIFRVGHRCGKSYTFFLSSEFERSQWSEAINILQGAANASNPSINLLELQTWVASCKQHLGANLGSFLLRSGKDDDLLVGDLHISVHSLHGLSRPSDIYVCFEVDSYGHFFNKARTKTCVNSIEPVFNQDFIVDLEGSQTLRILCYESTPEGAILRGKASFELSQSWLTDKIQEKSMSLQELMLIVGLKYDPPELSLRRIPSSKTGSVFGVKVQQVCKKEKSSVPFLMITCIKEVEKRGMHDLGIYRVSGSTSEVQRMKKSFETNIYEAEQLLKEIDIHTVTGLFKLYLRELPEALFTDALYQKFFRAFTINNQEEKSRQLLQLFGELPEINRGIITYLLDHLMRINQNEGTNKMSLHNLATVFGPTLLRPGGRSSSSSPSDLLTAGTVDVMAQAGIFYFFLKWHAAGLPLKLEMP